MKTYPVWFLGVLLAVPLSAAAQGAGGAGKVDGRTGKVEKAGGKLRKLRKKVNAGKVRRLVEALGSEDEKVREEAEERLEEMGKAVLPFLESLAEEENSPEVRWRIKKVVRAIRGRGPRIIPKGDVRPVTPEETEDFLEEMQQRLRKMMEEMEKDFGPFFGPGPSGIPRLRIPRIVTGKVGKVLSSGETVRLQIGPKGVELEIRRKTPGGKEEVKRYKAKDVEEFKKLYPEIARKYHIGGNGLSFRIGTPGVTDFSRRLEEILKEFGLAPGPGKGSPLTPPPPSPRGWGWWNWPGRGLRPVSPVKPLPAPSGEKLGVYVGPVPEALGDYLGLPPGYGLMVQDVLGGSLADRAGIEPKDILLEVNGVRIRDVEDVKNGLSLSGPGAKVKITVIRKGRKVVLEAVKGRSSTGVKTLKKVKV